MRKVMSSPRPWGCFQGPLSKRVEGHVFPTPVGVFLLISLAGRVAHSLPHARGGVSIFVNRIAVRKKSSPRPWGCFLPRPRAARRDCVFPTPVGVFLPAAKWCPRRRRLPHARGGVSPHGPLPGRAGASSPRPWGCFRKLWRRGSSCAVFPTPVGVFLSFCAWVNSILRLPHARGGVSRSARSTN